MTPEDTPINTSATGTDPDGDVLIFSILSGPNHGVVVDFDPLLGTGTYVPDPGYSGPDSVFVSVCDSVGGCDVGTITIMVVPENDPPVAVCFSTTATQGFAATLTLRASDPEGDPIRFEIVEAPEHGSVVEFDSLSGALVYLPNADYAGPDELVFRACDDSLACDTCVVQFLVVRVAGAGGGAAPCEQRVIISEIGWSGTRAGETHEWIELRNLDAEPVDLTGWTLRWRRREGGSERVWKTIPLDGVIGGAEPADSFRFVPNAEQDGTWWLVWEPAPRDDLFLLERASDEVVLPIPADLIYGDEWRLDASPNLEDLGEFVELVDPSGCIVDTANAIDPPLDGWVAGSAAPPASMERIDPFAPDVAGNWQTNLGLIRNGQDETGNLIHGTPRRMNSPVLQSLVSDRGLAPVALVSGDAIVVRIALQPEWSASEGEWLIVVLDARIRAPIAADWTIEESADGVVMVRIRSDELPAGEIHVWVRTPTGELIVATYVVGS